MAKRLTWYFMEAASNGASVPLRTLLESPDLPDASEDPLAALEALLKEATDHDVTLTPDPASVSDWDTEIVLSRIPENDSTKVGERISRDFLDGEVPNVEFKSTLWLDLRRQQNDPDATAADLKSAAVANSAMKTICGLLNESGGYLLIGVNDDGDPLGIEIEFQISCPTDTTIDGWLQMLRNTINQFFYESTDVSNHIKIEIGNIDDKTICLIGVIPRKRLSICKCKNIRNLTIYSRKGTSTDVIPPESVEDYVINRARRLNVI